MLHRRRAAIANSPSATAAGRSCGRQPSDDQTSGASSGTSRSSSTTAGKVATKRVSAAYPDEPLDEALEQMAYQQVRRLPVIEDDRVIGILAQADVVHEVRDKKAGHLVEEISQPRAQESGLG